MAAATHPSATVQTPPPASSASGSVVQPEIITINAPITAATPPQSNAPSISGPVQEVDPAKLRGKAYEEYRNANLARNKAILAGLGLDGGAAAHVFAPRERKRPTSEKDNTAPVRRSNRVKSG